MSDAKIGPGPDCQHQSCRASGLSRCLGLPEIGAEDQLWRVTPDFIHRTFISRRIASAQEYLAMARVGYDQDNPEGCMMALDLAASETVAAYDRTREQHGEDEDGHDQPHHTGGDHGRR